jgi:hypothetical protein
MHVDILSIHYRIIEYLKSPNRGHEERLYFNQLTTDFYQNSQVMSNAIKKDVSLQLETLSDNIRQITDESLLNFYLLKTQCWIEDFVKLSNKPIIIDFMKCSNKSKDDNETHIKKQSIINSYLEFIKKYFNAFQFIQNICGQELLIRNSAFEKEPTLLTREKTPMKCLKCSNETHFESFDNQNVCQGCGIVLDQFNQQSIISFKDVDRVNLNNKYTYDRKTHFRDCIYQFQGKQNVSISNKVYDDILQQLLSHGIIPQNYTDLPKEMAFEHVTKEHIFLFLKQTKHVKHYEDVILIYREITGKVVPDISHLEEKLILDFDLLVEQYDKKFKNHLERKNFINTQYILFQLLNRHHYPCTTEDFNMLKTIDRRYYHDEICSMLFEELGWNHKPIF